MVDSLRYLQSVGEQVRHAFVGNKTILSFQEYMEGFFEKPRALAQDKALSAENAAALNRLLQELAWDAVVRHPLAGVRAADELPAPK